MTLAEVILTPKSEPDSAVKSEPHPESETPCVPNKRSEEKTQSTPEDKSKQEQKDKTLLDFEPEFDVMSSLSPDISDLSLLDQPIPSIKLSYGRAHAGAFVTFIVGSAAEEYRIHRGRLDLAPPKIQDLLSPQNKRLSKDIRLRDDDPEAFGLLVDWLYGWGLPELGVWGNMTGFLSSAAHASLAILGTPTSFLPSRIDPNNFPRKFKDSADARGLGHIATSRGDHINFVEEYSHFSPEELRLLDTSWDVDLIESYTGFLRKSVPGVDEAAFEVYETYKRRGGGDRLKLQDRSEAKAFLQAEEVLHDGEACRCLEGEYFQFTLVKLIIFAAKYEWISLLNEAMQIYRKGETYMARATLPTRHIEMAYASLDGRSFPGKEVQSFMADYAFYVGKTRRVQSSWVKIGLKYPTFFQDVMRREDGSTQVPGFEITTRIWDHSKSPLSGKCIHVDVPASAASI